MKTTLITCFLFMTSMSLFAQATEIPITDLKTPPSPAFVLMGIAPSAVERPTTPRALGTSLLSVLSDGQGSSLPKNFALEVAPYWLQYHPTLTYDQYTKADFMQSIKQTLSISVATKQQTAVAGSATPADTVGGIGIRAAWLLGNPSQLENDLKQRIVDFATNQAIANASAIITGNQELIKLIDAFRSARYQGRWFVEGAAASTALFAGNDSSHSTHQKSGFWVTSSYRFARTSLDSTKTGADAIVVQPNIDFIAVVRSINDHTVKSNRNPLDLGGRLIWESGDLALSAEHVERRRTSKNTRRTVAMGEFKINDNLYLTATFGKNFKDENAGGDLIGIFGIHFSVGKTPVVPLSN